MAESIGRVLNWVKIGLMWSILLIALSVIALSGLTAAKITSTMVVISGSMEPTIHTGSLIVAHPVDAATLKVGDIASLQRNDGVFVTHRVVENDEAKNVNQDNVRSIRMKGDANNGVDPDPYLTKTAFTPVIVVPFVGNIWAFVMDKKMLLLGGLGFVVAIYVFVRYLLPFGAEKDSGGQNSNDEDDFRAGNETRSGAEEEDRHR